MSLGDWLILLVGPVLILGLVVNHVALARSKSTGRHWTDETEQFRPKRQL